jgi:hypothetical protein
MPKETVPSSHIEFETGLTGLAERAQSEFMFLNLLLDIGDIEVFAYEMRHLRIKWITSEQTVAVNLE